MATKRDAARIAELEVENWNLKHKVGTPVLLRMDSGDVLKTWTTSEAYICASVYAVCFFAKVRGYYLLDRATAVKLEACHAGE